MKQIAVVTGCAGFIGITLTRKLLESGWNVYGVDKLTYVANTDELLSLEIDFRESFNFVDSDICELDRLPECDVVFNLAAESDVDNSILNIDSFIKSNIDGVKNLLRLITHNSVQNKHNMPLFFHMSTDEVYGDLEDKDDLFTEDTKYDPSSPYSASKASCNHLVNAFSRTYGIKFLIINPSNNFGPYQYPEKLIPKSIIKIINKNSIPIYKKGKNIRQWMYVRDTCILIYKLTNNSKLENQSVNLGYGKLINNLNLIKIIFKFIRDKDNGINLKINFVDDRKGHDYKYHSSSEYTKKFIKFRPSNFVKNLHRTVEWYKIKKNLKLFKNKFK